MEKHFVHVWPVWPLNIQLSVVWLYERYEYHIFIRTLVLFFWYTCIHFLQFALLNCSNEMTKHVFRSKGSTYVVSMCQKSKQFSWRNFIFLLYIFLDIVFASRNHYVSRTIFDSQSYWNLNGIPGDGYYIAVEIGTPPQKVSYFWRI